MDDWAGGAGGKAERMTTWKTTFLVEPWPDTPWDARDLGLWRTASPVHSYATVADHRSVRVSTASEAAEEGTAVAAGREDVNAFFPPSRYTVQNPSSGPSVSTRRWRLAGAALFLRRADAGLFREHVQPR